jgi:predicted ATP-grasp superfamily ATP-dependent carboligase
MTTLQSRFVDYSNEKSSVGVYVADAITEANALLLNAAIVGMSIGTNQDAAILMRNEIFTGVSTPPTNKWAQREIKFVVKYTDTVTGKQYSFSIPCADAELVVGNTDMVDLSAGAGLTLKTRFDAHAISELGNPVVLDSVMLVGRSS